MKIVISGLEGETILERLSGRGWMTIHLPPNATADSVARAIVDADGYLLGGTEVLSADLLRHASRLKAISFVGTGIGSFVDVKEAKRQGIRLSRTPGVMARAVAEHSIGMLLSLRCRLGEQIQTVARGELYSKVTEELGASRVGIVGMGDIGQAIARVLVNGFGVELRYTSRTRRADVERELSLEYASLSQLLATSDVVIMALPTTDDTVGLIDETSFKAMRHGMILVNPAHPSIVEPLALLRALEAGVVAGVSMDGYYVDPIPRPDSDPFDLLKHQGTSVLVTPHSASKTRQSWSRMVSLAVDNLLMDIDCTFDVAATQCQ